MKLLPYRTPCSLDRSHGIGAYWLNEAIYLFALTDGRRLATLVQLPDEGWATISADGHLKTANPRCEREFFYVVQTADGQQTLTPAEFAEKYGWKNDPTKVKLAQ